MFCHLEALRENREQAWLAWAGACVGGPGCADAGFVADEDTRDPLSAQDHPKLRRGRFLRWADEDELPERAKKPTTPRDPRAFADRPSQSINQPSTAPNVPSTYGTPAPGGSLSAGVARAGSGASSSGEGRRPSYQASSADNMLSHGASGHSNTSDADMARRASRDSALVALSRAHHHRLRLPWGTHLAPACASAPVASRLCGGPAAVRDSVARVSRGRV